MVTGITSSYSIWLLLILKLHIVLTSKKIQSLGVSDEKNPTCGTELTLQQKIRLSAVNFLKENLLGLPNLPTEDQLLKLQAERRCGLSIFLDQFQIILLTVFFCIQSGD